MRISGRRRCDAGTASTGAAAQRSQGPWRAWSSNSAREHVERGRDEVGEPVGVVAGAAAGELGGPAVEVGERACATACPRRCRAACARSPPCRGRRARTGARSRSRGRSRRGPSRRRGTSRAGSATMTPQPSAPPWSASACVGQLDLADAAPRAATIRSSRRSGARRARPGEPPAAAKQGRSGVPHSIS